MEYLGEVSKKLNETYIKGNKYVPNGMKGLVIWRKKKGNEKEEE